MEQTTLSPLTPGQWEALLAQSPDQVRPLVVRLAIHHGHIKPDPDVPCIVCGLSPVKEAA